MNIILLNPPNIEEPRLDAHTIPLGLLSINEYLIKNGYESKVINLFNIESWHEIALTFAEHKYDLVGIPCYTRQRFSVFKLAEVCKKIRNECIVVLGGPHATYLDTHILEQIEAVDFIVRNEGEKAIIELVSQLSDKKLKYYNINNLTFRDKGQIIQNPSSNQLKDLSELPLLSYTKSDLECFPKCESLSFHFKKIEHTDQIAPILTSRGCAHDCSFCCNGSFWSHQYYYPIESVFNQIIYFIKEHNIRVFDFYDDNFTFSKQFVLDLCEKIIKNKLDIYWWCSSRASDIDEELVTIMKEAGCFMISLGVESGSQVVLDSFNKKVSISKIVESAKNIKKVGIDLRTTLTIGSSVENQDTIFETINIIKQIKPNQIGLFITKLYPGTALYEEEKAKKKIDSSYWFDIKNKTVPFYLGSYSIDKLLEFQTMIVNSLEDYIMHQYKNSVYSIELDLNWSEINKPTK